MSPLRASVVLSALVAWSAPAFAEEPGKGPVGEPANEPLAEPAKEPVKGFAEEPSQEPVGEPAKLPGEEPAKPPGPIASGAAAAANGAAAEPAKVPSTIDDMQWNRPMAVGFTMFGLSYLPCLLVGPLTEDADLLPLMIPIAGPLILASGSTAEPELGWAVFGTFAAAQALGAAIFAFGALLPREPTGPVHPKKKSSVAFHAAPFVTPTAWGAAAQGSF